jgi:hypothetical protein
MFWARIQRTKPAYEKLELWQNHFVNISFGRVI